MKTRFTLLVCLLTGLAAAAQTPEPVAIRPGWHPSELVARRMVSEPRRMYFGFDLGYYRGFQGRPTSDLLLQTSKATHDLFPGFTLGWHLNRRLSLETGLYNLPSTTSYAVEVHQTTPGMGGLGIQYAMVPFRLRVEVARPTRWLTAAVHAGAALAFNSRIGKGTFEKLSLTFPPVWGDTVAVLNEGEMIHNRALLLEAGAELRADLGWNVALVLYGRGAVGLQPLWRNQVSYWINQQDPPSRMTMTARANGLTAGLGLRYTFSVGRRWRTVWD
jgi:hypothetical protein